MKYSKDGYKRNSKDRNNPFNIIPSGNITMKGVDFPVFGMDNLGYSKIMMPGTNYIFPGSSVFEVPLARVGIELPIYQNKGEVNLAEKYKYIPSQFFTVPEGEFTYDWTNRDGTKETRTGVYNPQWFEAGFEDSDAYYALSDDEKINFANNPYIDQYSGDMLHPLLWDEENLEKENKKRFLHGLYQKMYTKQDDGSYILNPEYETALGDARYLTTTDVPYADIPDEGVFSSTLAADPNNEMWYKELKPELYTEGKTMTGYAWDEDSQEYVYTPDMTYKDFLKQYKYIKDMPGMEGISRRDYKKRLQQGDIYWPQLQSPTQIAQFDQQYKSIMNPIKKEDIELQKEFFDNAISGDLYKQKLIDQGYENVDEIINMRKNALANSNVMYDQDSSSYLDEAYDRDPNLIQKILDKVSFLNDQYKESGIDYDYKDVFFANPYYTRIGEERTDADYDYDSIKARNNAEPNIYTDDQWGAIIQSQYGHTDVPAFRNLSKQIMQGETGSRTYTSGSRQGDVVLDPRQIQGLNIDMGFEGTSPQLKQQLQNVLAHELGHQMGSSRNDIDYNLNENDYNYIQDRMNVSDDASSHDQSVYERKADLEALRYDMYRTIGYDYSKDVLTPEVLEQYKQYIKDNPSPNLPTERMFQFFNDEDIIDINNTVAQNYEIGDDISDNLNLYFDLPLTQAKYGTEDFDGKLSKLQDKINVYLNDPSGRAKAFSDSDEELTNIDNLRHAMAGRYTAEELQNLVKAIPYGIGNILDTTGVDKLFGFLGSNALGVGHELSTLVKDERPFLAALQESGEDVFNNFVGSIVGSTDVSSEKKDNILRYLSDNNLLPDGYVQTDPDFSENVYWKNEDGSIKKPNFKSYKDGGENDEDTLAYSRLLKRFIPSAAVLAKNPLLTFAASMLYPKGAGKGSTLQTPSLEQQYQNYLNTTTPEERVKNELQYELMTGRPFYFNPIPISNIKEHGGEHSGFDWKGYFKGEQGFIPDYGGKSTTQTYLDNKDDVQKGLDYVSMTGIPVVSQFAGYGSAGIDFGDAAMAYAQGDYDTAKKEFAKGTTGAVISTIPGGKTVAGLTKAGLQATGKNLAKGTIKGGVKSTIKNAINETDDTPLYAENLEEPIYGGMLPETTVTPKTKYGTELPIAQTGTFKTLAQKGLNAYNKYIFNKSKDAFGISGRMLMDDLTLPVANSANLMLHRSLDNTYIPNLSGSDLDNYHKLITQYTINSEPFKFSSFPENQEVSFPMEPSFMNTDGTPLYTFDNRFARELDNIINSNKVIFKGDQNKPLTLVREFEGFTDVPVGKDFYFTKDYYGDMNKLNSYIDALKSGKTFNLGDISSWSVGANTGLNRFGSNRFIIENFPLSQNALINKYDSPLFSKNQKGIFRERELLLPSTTQFKVKDIQFNVPRKPYHYTKDDAGKITDFSPHYGADIILDVQNNTKNIKFKKEGGQTKYKKSVFNKNKMSLSDPSRLINQMLKQGIFKSEFKMGGEQKLSNGYTIKKEFDNTNNIPFISYTNEPDIEGRVYYESDDDAQINVIDIETKLNQIRSKHERTKKIILKRREGKVLSNTEKQHLNSLGLL